MSNAKEFILLFFFFLHGESSIPIQNTILYEGFQISNRKYQDILLILDF